MLTMLNDENLPILTECFDISVYVRRSFYDCEPGVISFYKQILNLVGKELSWYYTESMGRPKKISAKVLEMVPSWFSPGARPRETYQMTMRAGKNADEITPTRFYLEASETPPGEMPSDDPAISTGILRLTLPTAAAETPDGMVALMKSLVENLPYVSGHAGFGLVWEEKELDLSVKTRIRTWARRYPGLDVFGFLSFDQFVLRGIKCVNWLTLINQDCIDRLGGIEAIRSKLSEPVILHDLPNGLLVQAGPRPVLGDTNKEENVPLYHAVGRVLEPVRDKADAEVIYPFVGGPDETIKWLARFDR